MTTIATLVGPAVTMSSKEIADLVEKRHDNVKRTIETLEKQGVISHPQIEDGARAANGVVEKIYRVGKRDSYVLVAQLSPEFTARLVDRWQELEVGAQPSIPQTLPEALRPAADLADQVAQVESELALAAPKARALDRMSASDEAVTMTQAAKLLGIKRDRLTSWLNANGWIYRQNGSWVAYQHQIQAGRLQYKEANYTDEKTGLDCCRPYCHIMPKGLAKLAEVFEQVTA